MLSPKKKYYSNNTLLSQQVASFRIMVKLTTNYNLLFSLFIKFLVLF